MTPDGIVAYLLERRLLSLGALVRGDVVVEDASRRNRNSRVTSTTSPGYFLKQAEPGDTSGGPELESAFYRLARRHAGLAGLRPFLPRLILHDPARRLMVFPLRPALRPLNTVPVPRTRATSVRNAAMLGRVLAAVHRAEVPDPLRAEPLFAAGIPWAFSLARPGADFLRDAGPVQLEIVKLVQRSPDLVTLLDRLRRTWARQSLVHCDFRWDNVLVESSGKTGRIVALNLADWESACLGDPAWDVGSALQAYLAFGVASLDLTSASEREAASRFALQLRRLRPMLGGLWRGYAGHAKLTGPSARRFLDRALEHCAARLVQTAFEWSGRGTRMPLEVVCLLQLAVNLARGGDPARELVLRPVRRVPARS